MRKQTDFVALIAVLLVVIASLFSGAVVLFSENNFWAQAITTVTAVIGAFAIWFQMRKGKKLNEGDFLVKLNQQFIKDENIQYLYLKLEHFRRYKKCELTDEDIPKVLSYATFFEVIYLLIQRNIIKISMIDDLFSYQFFLMINNPEVQNLEILPCLEYYDNLFRLYAMWKKFREDRELYIPNIEYDVLERLDESLRMKYLPKK